MDVDRRGFLRGMAAGLTALLSSSADSQKLMARPSPLTAADGSCPRFGVFDDVTFAILEAVAEQIVPADQDPGATDFCSASLVEAISAGDPATAQLLTAGLGALDDSSQVLFGLPFTALAFDQQTELLLLVEAGEAPGDGWEEVLPEDLQRAPGESLSASLRHVVENLERYLPAKHTLGCAATCAKMDAGAAAQQTVFASLRTFCKLAFVLNFPETSVRNADGTPIFSDAQHLISDPDDDATLTGWTVVEYHEIDYETEKLMWEWQAGYRVIGFDGVPILDTDAPLTEAERLAARDTLYALSDQGLA